MIYYYKYRTKYQVVDQVRRTRPVRRLHPRSICCGDAGSMGTLGRGALQGDRRPYREMLWRHAFHRISASEARNRDPEGKRCGSPGNSPDRSRVHLI